MLHEIKEFHEFGENELSTNCQLATNEDNIIIRNQLLCYESNDIATNNNAEKVDVSFLFDDIQNIMINLISTGVRE